MTFRVTSWLLAAILAWQADVAAAQGFLDFDDEPQAPPAAGTAATSVPGTTGPAAIAFNGLAGCENGLSGLPPVALAALTDKLDKRLTFWAAQGPKTIKPISHPRQADYALDCFDRRIGLLATYVPPDPEARKARDMAKRIVADWGPMLGDLLTGTTAPFGDLTWWDKADAAFVALTALEQQIGKVGSGADDERAALLDAARASADGLRLTLAEAKRRQAGLGPAERAWWLLAMTWKAKLAGQAVDRLQRHDLAQDAEAAYAHLLAADDARGREAQLAPGLAPLLARLKALREGRGPLDPGGGRDWSAAGRKSAILEDLYLLRHSEATMPARIAEYQERQAKEKKWELEYRLDEALYKGVPESQIKPGLLAEWRDFRAKQKQDREFARKRWEQLFIYESGRAKAAGAFASDR